MRCRFWFTVGLLLTLASQSRPSGGTAGDQTGKPSLALERTTFRPLPLGGIKPTGWVREQLEIQASGLDGRLDEFWPDIKKSASIEGKAQGWERVPHWLDGLVPLAYLLDVPALQARTRRIAEFILEHRQKELTLISSGSTDLRISEVPTPASPDHGQRPAALC